MSDGLGELFIAVCLKESSFSSSFKMGFKIEMFQSENCHLAWDYCISLLVKKETPSKEEIAVRFKIDVSVPDGATTEGVFRRIRDRAFSYDIKKYVEDALKLIAVGNPEEALNKLLSSGSIKPKYLKELKGPLSYRKSFEERIIAYRMLKESGGCLGAVTRWPTFNKETKGFQNGFFHVFAALTSTGKSWALMLLVDDLLQQKRRPLIVSTEMAPIRLQFRLDCLRHKLPYGELKDATLPDLLEEEWIKRMMVESEDGEMTDAIFVGKEDVKSVQDVYFLAQELGVTDVLIDGGYRLSSSREWKDQAKIVEEMQIHAEKSNIPWIVTVQLGDSGEKGKSFEAKVGNKWNIRYAKEWLIDPDVVVLMTQNQDLRLANQMQLEFGKIRDGDGKPKTFRIHWDRETMNYNEVSEEEETKEAEIKLADIGKVKY